MHVPLIFDRLIHAVKAVARHAPYPGKGEAVELRLPAIVTRIQGDGLALTFGRYDDQAYTDLANLLYAAK